MRLSKNITKIKDLVYSFDSYKIKTTSCCSGTYKMKNGVQPYPAYLDQEEEVPKRAHNLQCFIAPLTGDFRGGDALKNPLILSLGTKKIPRFHV